MDLLRAAMVGAAGTPYQDGLFFFDLQLPPSYPAAPPQVCYRSFGLCVNPNLDKSGTVCLSLLGTFDGEGPEVPGRRPTAASSRWSSPSRAWCSRSSPTSTRPATRSCSARPRARATRSRPLRRERLPHAPEHAAAAPAPTGGVRGARRGALPPPREARAPGLRGVHADRVPRRLAGRRGARPAGAAVLEGVRARARQHHAAARRGVRQHRRRGVRAVQTASPSRR
jgi:hypothetical protein